MSSRDRSSDYPLARDLSLEQWVYATLSTPGIHVNPLDNHAASPAVNGWTAACILSLGRKQDSLCEKLLDSKFPGTFVSYFTSGYKLSSSLIDG